MHLFISSASLPRMEVNFLNQKPCIPSCPGAFHFHISFSVVFCKSTCISILGPSSSPSSSLLILFIHSAFSLFLWLPYFCPKSIGLFYIQLLVYFHVTPFQLLIEFSFVVLECPVVSVFFFTLFRYLFILPSLVSTFCFFSSSCIVIVSHVACSFFPLISVSLFRIIRACFRSFLFAFPVEFPISVLTVSSCFLRGSQFSYKLILLQHRLVHLTRLYYSSVCKVVCDLFNSFLY